MALNGEAVLAIQSTSTCLVTGRRRFINSKEHPFLIIFRQGQHPSRHIRAIHHNHQPSQVPDYTSAAINHQGWVCGIDIEIDVPKPRIFTASEVPELQVEVNCIQASFQIPQLPQAMLPLLVRRTKWIRYDCDSSRRALHDAPGVTMQIHNMQLPAWSVALRLLCSKSLWRVAHCPGHSGRPLCSPIAHERKSGVETGPCSNKGS